MRVNWKMFLSNSPLRIRKPLYTVVLRMLQVCNVYQNPLAFEDNYAEEARQNKFLYFPNKFTFVLIFAESSEKKIKNHLFDLLMVW